MSLMEGAVVGNYRILSKLGEGGMGTVYRAVDTMIHREVAIKALRAEIAAQPDVLDRFRSEAVLLAKLNHPSIAQLYAFFSEGGQFYMVMEYIAGNTFERVIQQQGAMEWQRACNYLMQILDGIGHAHASGILHRDLKPANVMLTPAGRIKLMDFGIAQALGAARMTRQGRIIGTLEYLAPERIQGKPPDARSDLYSVGVMLFEMLSGRLPFQSDSEYELLQQQIQMAPPDLGKLGVQAPAEVEAVMRRALEKDPAKRYADAEEFSAALTALLPTRPTASKVIPMPLVEAAPPASPSLMSKPLFWLAVTGVLVALAVGIVMTTLFTRPAVKRSAVAEVSPPQQVYQPPPSSAPLQVDTTPVMVQPPVAKEAPPPAAKEVVRPSLKETAPPAAHAPVPTPAQTTPQVETIPAPAPAPPPPPAPVAPAAPVRAAIARLSDAHSIFVAGDDAELVSNVRAEIGRQLGGSLKLAASAGGADIVMRVTLEEQKGKGVAQAGRLFGMKDHAQVRAVITDSHTSRVLWQQGAGDKKPIVGAFRGESVKRLAERIVKELRESYNR